MDGQVRCSSAERRKDIDIFKGFVLRLGCIRAIRTKKLKEARYDLKVVTVCNFG
jgi:hypothetical protein